MSDDYLSSLGARTFAMASVVRPRLAARFEPRRAAADLSRFGPAPDGVPRHESGDELPTDPDASWLRRYDRPTVTAGAIRTLASDPELDLSPHSAPPGQAERDAGRGQAEPVVTTELFSRSGSLDQAAAPRGWAEARQEPQSPSRVGYEVGELAVPSVPRSPQGPAVAGARQRETPTDSLPDRPAAIPVPTRRAGRSTPQEPQAGNKAIGQNAPGQAPTIQVTIGRVEVRATTSPALQPARHPASPVTTLEEYLHRKTERGNS